MHAGPEEQDLMVCGLAQVADDEIYLVVNAGCREKDLAHIGKHLDKYKVQHLTSILQPACTPVSRCCRLPQGLLCMAPQVQLKLARRCASRPTGRCLTKTVYRTCSAKTVLAECNST